MTDDNLFALIPPEVVEAARTAWLESASDYTRLDESIRAALSAGLGAWPLLIHGPEGIFLPAILPLSTEGGE